MTTDPDFYTTDQLMARYPQVKFLGWTSAKIGNFFSAGLLIGHHVGKEKQAVILESSFIELIEFANTVNIKRQIFTHPKQ